MEELTPVQVRIIGCLLEKERHTPDNYPLTMNSLLLACNQTTNRHPVVAYNEPTVSNALSNLRSAGVVRVVYSRSNRAERYRHVIDEILAVDEPDLALLAALMVRGPQTAGELRTRAERMHPFADVAEVEATLKALAGRSEALVTLLPLVAGHKEPRWAQLLGGPVSVDDVAPAGAEAGRGGRGDRLTALEALVDELTGELSRLRADHDALAGRLGELLD